MAGTGAVVVPLPSGGGKTVVELRAGAVGITYGSGWTEALAGGRYVLRDPEGRTVAERAATAADVRRIGPIAVG
jgi:hypothetical protein